MLYSSIDNKKIKDIKKLYQKKYREEQKSFLVEGEHLVEEAYKSGYLESIIIEDGYDFHIEKNNIYVTDKVMNYLSELDHNQHIMGICKLLNNNNIGSKVLILDDIQDPGNLGTIIRSVVAFNFDTLILSKNTVDIYNSKVIRASQGLIFKTNVIISDLKEIINDLKSRNYKIIGTKVDNGIDIKDIPSTSSLALIMGNEGNGVSSDILNLCDCYAHINMNKECESLNVGVATSIMLYELNK